MPLKISIIIPTYNEAANVASILDVVHRALHAYPHEILIVDDESPDHTADLAEKESRQSPWVKVIRRHGPRDLSAAVLVGFESASGDILGVMDADLSHDEGILPALIEAVRSGADLAVGSRRVKGGGATHWPWYRRMTSALATWLSRQLLHLPLSDPMSGYFLLPRRVYDASRTRLEPSGYKILLEIVCKAQPARIVEIPFIFKDRTQGYSKLNAWVAKHYFKMLLNLWRERA